MLCQGMIGYTRYFGVVSGVRLGSSEQIRCACVMLGTWWLPEFCAWFRAGIIGYMFLHVFANMRIGVFFIPGYFWICRGNFGRSQFIENCSGRIDWFDLICVWKIPGAKGEKTLAHNTCGVVEYLVHSWYWKRDGYWNLLGSISFFGRGMLWINQPWLIVLRFWTWE